MNWKNRLKALIAAELKQAAPAFRTKKELAALIGVAPAAITQWTQEDGTKMIEGDKLVRVCLQLKVSPEHVIEGTDPQKCKIQYVTQTEAELLAGFRATDDEGRTVLSLSAKAMTKKNEQNLASGSVGAIVGNRA